MEETPIINKPLEQHDLSLQIPLLLLYISSFLTNSICILVFIFDKKLKHHLPFTRSMWIMSILFSGMIYASVTSFTLMGVLKNGDWGSLSQGCAVLGFLSAFPVIAW